MIFESSCNFKLTIKHTGTKHVYAQTSNMYRHKYVQAQTCIVGMGLHGPPSFLKAFPRKILGGG